ncbi:MAG TPA: peptidoglycan DD-metalloendopeptidase family protein [Stellaceae bacterium]|nr:peptidoglycan DD-metalloendopeptidase family protein [Stellaceae bacterium]
MFLLFSICLLAQPALADDTPQDRLKAVQQELQESREKELDYARQADALAGEIEALRADSIAAARAAQEHESALSGLEAELARLGAAETAKAADLKQHRTQLEHLLMALTLLSRNPPEGMALGPGDPLDGVRSGILLGAAVPPIIERAKRLRAELESLADLRRQIGDAEAAELAERTKLDQEQARLNDVIAKKAALQDEARRGADESSQQQFSLASQAFDLQQLIERLDAERKKSDAAARLKREEQQKRLEAERLQSQELMRQQHPESEPETGGRKDSVVVALPPPLPRDPTKPAEVRPFAKAKGFVLSPVSGSLVRHFGDPDELGVAAKGLTFETRQGAQIVAPYDGRILFAGAFKGYGQILIIEHGDGYHSLLAGLDQIEGTVGQWLVAGEPVGTMPRGVDKPRLYLELRHDGQPINPLPWLATRDEKVSG